MKKLLQTLTLSLYTLLLFSQAKDESISDLFMRLKGVDSVNFIRTTNYQSELYELWFRQQIDHNNATEGYFPHRVLFDFRDYKLPVVVVIEGYSVHSLWPSEPAMILNANQLVIEHRFFAKSRPADSIPWSKLNIFNSASDQHAIIQAFKPLFNNKWVSTGISKGGQATIFHRFFYPNDVDASIPYVAPLNYSEKDERVFLFLDTVGTKECRKKLYQFQKELLKRKNNLLPFFKDEITKNKWTFPMSIDSIYDLSVFETSFGWWQWGNGKCDEIPVTTAHDTVLYKFFGKVGAADFFTNKSIDYNRPFFYQAMTEIGMYGYNTKPFEGLTKLNGIIDFDFTLPVGYNGTKFNPESMKEVDEWVKTKANNILYIYGGQDAWSSTAAQPGETTNSLRFFRPNGNHATRISSFAKPMQDTIVSILSNWLDMKLEAPYKIYEVHKNK